MEFLGKVLDIIDKSGESKKTGQPFKAALLVVEEEQKQYPQTGVFELYGEKVNYPTAGDNVRVEFNLKGSQYDGKWFGKLNAWKVEILSAASQAPTPHETAVADPLADTPTQPDGASDDLPFSSGSR